MRYLAILCAAGFAWAQGTTPKANPDEYPAHAVVGNLGVGAEFTVHSFGRGEQMFVTPDHLVVEVALFPPKGHTVRAEPGKFTLRVNGKKNLLSPEAPSMVAASLNHPAWEQRRGAEIGAGVGPVIFDTGQPGTAPFPGAPGPRTNPRPADIPDATNPSGVERERVKPEELLAETALPEGEHRGAVSGFLYFAYKGRISSIKSLDLLYDGAVLKLR